MVFRQIINTSSSAGLKKTGTKLKLKNKSIRKSHCFSRVEWRCVTGIIWQYTDSLRTLISMQGRAVPVVSTPNSASVCTQTFVCEKWRWWRRNVADVVVLRRVAWAQPSDYNRWNHFSGCKQTVMTHSRSTIDDIGPNRTLRGHLVVHGTLVGTNVRSQRVLVAVLSIVNKHFSHRCQLRQHFTCCFFTYRSDCWLVKHNTRLSKMLFRTPDPADLGFTAILSSVFSFFRQLPSEFPKRNSTKTGRMLGSECDLKMYPRNLRYTLCSAGREFQTRGPAATKHRWPSNGTHQWIWWAESTWLGIGNELTIVCQVRQCLVG